MSVKLKDRIQFASDVEEAIGLDMFLTGAPGAGKTALIGSAADLYPNAVLIVNCTAGIRTIADRRDIHVFTPDAWKDVKDLGDELSKGMSYKVVSVDLASEAYRLAVAEVVKEGYATRAGQPTQEGWGIANTRFLETIKTFRLLAVRQGAHVIFTSHTTETKDESTGAVLIRPNLTPGTLSSVTGQVDVVAYMDVNRKNKRTLHLFGSDRFWAKARRPLSMGPVPEEIDNPTFESLLSTLGIAV